VRFFFIIITLMHRFTENSLNEILKFSQARNIKL
jgi:hypothetical protein